MFVFEISYFIGRKETVAGVNTAGSQKRSMKS